MLKKNFSLYFRRCAGCGKSWGEMDWLCWRCEGRLFGLIHLKRRKISNSIDHLYLIDWDPHQQWISELVRSLKGGGPLAVYKNLMLIFQGGFAPALEEKKDRISIVYPSKGLRDHAWQLATELSQTSSIPSHALQLRGQKKQALLNRKQRLSVEFAKMNGLKTDVILVDDVVTTGATAKAAYKACGQPKNFAVWSLFYRKSLR